MKALCVLPDRTLAVRNIPEPANPPPEHVILRMEACGINPGDKFFLNAPMARSMPGSLHDVWGASGVGTVIQAGPGVASTWMGRAVTVYRSLYPSQLTLGTWSELAQVPVRCCALIPQGLEAADFSGSLVNVITAYAFTKQAQVDGHRGVVITAGTSATGSALIGIAQRLGLPTVALARNERQLERLRALGAGEVIVGENSNFEASVQATLEAQSATAVFDGVGGALLTGLIPRLALGSVIYSYGYLGGGNVPVQIPTLLLMSKTLTFRSFSNTASPTVRDPEKLDAALSEISELLELPHCKTMKGRTYRFEQVHEALDAVGRGEGKPVLVPG